MPSPTRSGQRAATILVVDDEWLIRWSMRQVLVGAGYEVIEAGDVASALVSIGGRPDIAAVLLDLKLPDGDGFAVLRELKASRPGCPVIMMTAHGGPDDERRALAAGVFRFVVKPFEQAALVEAVGDALDHAA